MRNAVRLVLILACSAIAAAPASGATASRATVAGVVDGDTIRVKLAGRTATVNLLGVRAATGCGTDGTATLRALLPARAKVRLVRDGRPGAAYVFRGSTFVNAELLDLGVAKAGRLRGLRRARSLRAAARWAREMQLGVWSCTPEPAAPAPGAAGDAVLAEIDRYVRGHRFTVTDEGGSGEDAYRIEMEANFCADGRLVVAMRATGSAGTQDGGRTTGTWKLLGVARSDGQAFLGRFESVFPEEDEGEPSEFFVGRRADGTPVVGDGEEQMAATRAPADAC